MTELLSGDHLEALQESFNIGIGRAAADLADLLGQEIGLGIPKVRCIDVDQGERFVLEVLYDSVVFVRQEFHGSFDGAAVLIFRDTIGMTLAQLLLDELGLLHQMDDVQEDAVVEVGNVILNGVISGLSELLNAPLGTTLPRFRRMSAEGIEMQRLAAPDSVVILVDAELGVADQALGGVLALQFDPASFNEFKRRSVQAFGFGEHE